MKHINDFIIEKFKINKDTQISKIDYKKDWKDLVKETQDLAKEKGLEVKFRNRKMNTGDFCFFIYDKRKQQRYLVGYDGDWDVKDDDTLSFKSCYEKTLKYIKEYK